MRGLEYLDTSAAEKRVLQPALNLAIEAAVDAKYVASQPLRDSLAMRLQQARRGLRAAAIKGLQP